jgi:hypothetical protein
MKPSRHPKAGDCLISAADGTESSATISFSALPAAAYVNGVPIGSAGCQPGDGPGELRVGATAGPTEYFGGMIDNVRIYSRALSAEEVVALYKQGR